MLIGVVRRKKDLEIILKKHLYRIPLKHCPVQKFDYIAFYGTSLLGKEGKAINYYARVKRVSDPYWNRWTTWFLLSARTA